jgi:cardiolipin synthase A/B
VSSIDITTPYFLPDAALRRAIVRAALRGVRIRVIIPGRHTDQRMVRFASRRRFRALLESRVRMFEYRPAMTHAKAMTVDDTWTIIGTTNIDIRSFEHNDEVNVAFRDPSLTKRMRRDFDADLSASDEVTLESWLRRPVLERIVAPFCGILERQQ